MNYRKVKKVFVTFHDKYLDNLPESTTSVKLSVTTKCPEKYLLIDRETGVVYTGTSDVNPHMPEYSLWKEIK
jgi:hypothetical protein